MRRKAVIDIDLGADLLLAVLPLPNGSEIWSELVTNLWRSKLLSCVWSDCEPEPILCIGIDLSNSDLSGRSLDGYDLSRCWSEGTNFSNASMQGAHVGCCPRAQFVGCGLIGAMFSGEVTGVDFSGATLTGSRWEDCCYDLGDPPKGLPPSLLKKCRAVPADVPHKATGSPRIQPVSCRARLILPSASRAPLGIL